MTQHQAGTWHAPRMIFRTVYSSLRLAWNAAAAVRGAHRLPEVNGIATGGRVAAPDLPARAPDLVVWRNESPYQGVGESASPG